MSKYRFIDVQKANHTIRDLCRTLRVPESSYYRWDSTGRKTCDKRAAADAGLLAQIRRIHDGSTETYGAPRVRAELVDEHQVRVSKKRVARLMRANGLNGMCGRKRSVRTTKQSKTPAPFGDLMNQTFTAAAPDVAWYGDITYCWAGTRFWYLATVIDAATKQVVGWSYADHMRDDLVINALDRAVARRGQLPDGVIFHSDRGSQYTSKRFQEACQRYRIRQSMGRKATCFDNAAAESFFATLKRELVDRYIWKSGQQLHLALFRWIEGWYNNRRRHSTIGYRSPNQAWADHTRRHGAA